MLPQIRMEWYCTAALYMQYDTILYFVYITNLVKKHDLNDKNMNFTLYLHDIKGYI